MAAAFPSFSSSFSGNLQHCLAQAQEKASDIWISYGHPDKLQPTKKDMASKDSRWAHKHPVRVGNMNKGGKKGRQADDGENNIKASNKGRDLGHGNYWSVTD